MGLRRKAREMALEVLYLCDVSSLSREKAMVGVLKSSDLDSKTKIFMNRLIEGVLDKRETLDNIIIKYSENWEMKRMAALDRNILRLGSYELLYEKETPVSVVIDEAVEIAKSFSTPDSGKFVNGILDKVKNERKR